MRLRPILACIALQGVVAVGVVSTGSTAHAAPASQPSAEDRRAASQAFKEGDRAFAAGDFRAAAVAYEAAYVRAPHHAPLWNAARAWDSAGEPARAANLYARYLREAPARAPDRDRATEALKKLASKLGRIDLHVDPGLEDATIDDAPAGADGVYVNPGQHVVSARAGASVVREETRVGAGEVTSVALTRPEPTERSTAPKGSDAARPPSASEASANAPAPSHAHAGWSPVVVAFGGAVTLLVGGIAVWSGLDTLHQKDVFDASPTPSNLDQGRSKEQRTNILVAASAGVGLLTVAAAAFLVDWHGEHDATAPAPTGTRSIRVDVGVGSLGLRGAF